MEPHWDRPLDGLDEVAWDELLSPDDAAELVSALRSLAAEGGNENRIYDVLEDNDHDYWYATVSGKPEGFRPAAVPTLRFLARIAAQPSGVGSETALELIETIADAALDRPTMTGVELDAMVDALRAELDAARPALAEAGRLGRAGDYPVRRLLVGVDAGVLLGGAYEPRWRGVARPLLDSPTGRLTVAGGMLITREKSDLAFRSPHDGEPIHTFSYPGPEGAWPFAGSISQSSVLFSKDELSVHPFVDRDGPGVLTVDADGRHPRLWRPVGADWRATPLVRPGLRLRPSARRAMTVAAHGGECFVGHADGVVLRFDARTGVPSGRPITLTANSAMLGVDDDLLMVTRRTPEGERNLIRIALATGRPVDPLFGSTLMPPVRYVAEGRPRLAFTDGSGPYRKLYRIDAETGLEIGSPIGIGDLNGFCVYELGGRPCLAVAGCRQVHRLDAETGEPVGPPLFGHRRIVLDVASAPVDGRAVLYSADGATVRRWDAETGTPWPAAVPS
ncbi:hypothetical protein [Streptomyces sp. NBC_00459]|uniref:hypothetical protein n=1 Tax=Streptomyces sp. NBC_00459 TaxID=2975749 RepID=UPI002E184A98